MQRAEEQSTAMRALQKELDELRDVRSRELDREARRTREQQEELRTLRERCERLGEERARLQAGVRIVSLFLL
jgi:protein SPA2